MMEKEKAYAAITLHKSESNFADRLHINETSPVAHFKELGFDIFGVDVVFAVVECVQAVNNNQSACRAKQTN